MTKFLQPSRESVVSAPYRMSRDAAPAVEESLTAEQARNLESYDFPVVERRFQGWRVP